MVLGIGGRVGSPGRRIVRIGRWWIVPLGLVLGSRLVRILVGIGTTLWNVGRRCLIATGSAASAGYCRSRRCPRKGGTFGSMESRPIGTDGLRRSRGTTAGGRGAIGRIRSEGRPARTGLDWLVLVVGDSRFN